MGVLSQSQGTSLQHDCGKQRILKVLNLEDTPLKAPSAFAIERSRGDIRAKFTPPSQCAPRPVATAVEGVHLDATHNADRDDDLGGNRVILFSVRLQGGCVYHCIVGSSHGCGLQPLHRQLHGDSAFHGSSGHLYKLPSDAVIPPGLLHTRRGDSGAFRSFADTPWKVYPSVCA